MPKKSEISFFLEHPEDEEDEVELSFSVYPGEEDYYSRSAGCWYPGSPPEAEFLSAVSVKTKKKLSQDEVERLFGDQREQAIELGLSKEALEPDYDYDDDR